MKEINAEGIKMEISDRNDDKKWALVTAGVIMKRQIQMT